MLLSIISVRANSVEKSNKWNHREWHFYFNSIFAHVFGNSIGKWLQFIKKCISSPDWTGADEVVNNSWITPIEKSNKIGQYRIGIQSKFPYIWSQFVRQKKQALFFSAQMVNPSGWIFHVLTARNSSVKLEKISFIWTRQKIWHIQF